MNKVKEVLRLHYEMSRSRRQISVACGISIGSVQTIIRQAQHCQLSWPLPDDVTDDELTARLRRGGACEPAARVEPDWGVIHQELRQKGVTRQLLWEEYVDETGDKALSYSYFCARYSTWRKQQKHWMRHTHRAGEKCFVDYSGQTVEVTENGKVRTAQVFVAARPHHKWQNNRWKDNLTRVPRQCEALGTK